MSEETTARLVRVVGGTKQIKAPRVVRQKEKSLVIEVVTRYRMAAQRRADRLMRRERGGKMRVKYAA